MYRVGRKKKAASALLGIIGSIISWILRMTVNVVGWLAQNLWAFLVASGAHIIAFLNIYNQKRQRRGAVRGPHFKQL